MAPPPTTSFLFTLLSLLPFLFAAPLPQSGDNGSSGDLPSGGLGYDPSAQGDADPGSYGKDTGAVSLSKGATIAIAVVAGVTVIGGITTATLFYIAKKRQWALAAKMRASARRVGTPIKRVGTGIVRVMTPRTPHKMTFSPIEKRSAEDAGLLRSPSTESGPDQTKSRAGDAEKAAGPAVGAAAAAAAAAAGAQPQTHGHAKTLSTVQEENARSRDATPSSTAEQQQERKPRRPAPPPVTVPKSQFDMDSPRTPMWARIFGR